MPGTGKDGGRARDGAPRPTQRTIAGATGFAVTTVSKALADDPSIAEKTRRTIQTKARELGYVPDLAARRLRTGRTNVVSLVLDPHSELLGFGASMIEGISEELRSTSYHLTIMQYQLGEDPMEPIEYVVRNNLADGLIFARTEPDDPRVVYLGAAGFPFITHGRTRFATHAWYDYDNADFAAKAVGLLAAGGATRIGIVPPNHRFTFRTFMLDGFETACRAHGITPLVAPDVDLNAAPDLIYGAMRDWLVRADAPDALICPGEASAMAAHAAQRDIGVDVPMIVKQTSRTFDFFRPKPYTIPEDIRSAGRVMTRALLKLIGGAAPRDYQILVKPDADHLATLCAHAAGISRPS
jgi:LacI family transcriptional regulator